MPNVGSAWEILRKLAEVGGGGGGGGVVSHASYDDVVDELPDTSVYHPKRSGWYRLPTVNAVAVTTTERKILTVRAAAVAGNTPASGAIALLYWRDDDVEGVPATFLAQATGVNNGPPQIWVMRREVGFENRGWDDPAGFFDAGVPLNLLLDAATHNFELVYQGAATRVSRRLVLVEEGATL